MYFDKALLLMSDSLQAFDYCASQNTWGAVGCLTKFYTPRGLTYLFYIPFTDKLYPFHPPCLKTLHPFQPLNSLSFKFE